MGRIINIKWPELNLSAKMELEDDKNLELCNEVWENLPFVCIQEHGMVTGKIIYTWAPIVSFSPIRFSQLHTKSPVGRVSYSQGTGNKIIIKYGECSEDCLAPVLGLINKKDHETLDMVGKIIWDNYFHDKNIYTVSFERGE